MNSISAITPESGNISRTAPVAPAVRGTQYRDIEAVRNRANVSAGNETPAQRNALNRLEFALSSDQPPRTDVPRGYYLDILV